MGSSPQRDVQLVKPYWVDNPDANKVRLALGGVVVLSLCTTGVSVVFNFLGRDFFNALSNKDEATFYGQLAKYLGGFAVGIPVFVFRDYFTVRRPLLPLVCTPVRLVLPAPELLCAVLRRQ